MATPVESWDAGNLGLPYGWEAAFDREGEDLLHQPREQNDDDRGPRKDSDEEPPLPRDIELVRDPQKGFGFVAGSEKPVIVRFVTEDKKNVKNSKADLILCFKYYFCVLLYYED
ncbi:FERM and PDZ domain-containing protein 4 [Caerostris extrusa]|uniref:FERM and PDZ domain-containing protein 4 n=1 Tax=Caerostris extrusa TaxID=172846 RepID=A0AAV4RHM4_CAEEX|nr:FERM and PDZ domain-containing protein 4 [Caerostris extrusa]